jgi:hypothetical protein
MDRVNFVLGKVKEFYNYICQLVDRPEVILGLAIAAILISLGFIRIRR